VSASAPPALRSGSVSLSDRVPCTAVPARSAAPAPQAPPAPDSLERQLEDHRRELTGYCYRMLGSSFEAEDAVQDTMVRAWRGIDAFEGRSSLRSWLYRIATNVCLDMLRGPQRRARPMDLGPSSTADSTLAPGLPENVWIQPVPDAWVLPSDGDPAELAAARETIRLAFVAALQRARATLAAVEPDDSGRATVEGDQQELLARYVTAFERYDIDSLVTLLHEDATFSMPPYALWLRGPVEVSRWLLGQGIGCRGSRLVATSANGCAAFGSYRQAGPGRHEPFAIQVLEFSGSRISGFHNFLGSELFAVFGLPPHLES
jgi:RNA polymerase sigma-70 factor (ECF subfamily)